MPWKKVIVSHPKESEKELRSCSTTKISPSSSGRNGAFAQTTNNGSSDSSTVAQSKSSSSSTGIQLREEPTTEERLKSTPTPLDSLLSEAKAPTADSVQPESSTDPNNSDPWQLISGGGTAGTGVSMTAGAPAMAEAQRGNLLYRSLGEKDPTMGQLRSGESIRPSDIRKFESGGPKNTRENVTLRQLRPYCDKRTRGSDRISVTNDLEGIIKFAQENPERFSRQDFVQVNPKKLGGNQVLSTSDLMRDLDKLKDQAQLKLDQRTELRTANGQDPAKLSNADVKLQQKIAAVERAKADVQDFKESHVVNEIPAKAVREVTPGQVQTANRILKGARIGGSIMTVVGVGFSIKRIADAPEDQRARVITQEAGATAGGIAGGVAGAKLGAMIGVAGGPVGIAVGAVVGGLVGGAIGGALSFFAADKAFSFLS